MIQKKKTYYYELGINELDKLASFNEHPTICIHTCCAVCATVPLEQLSKVFKITLFFNNSNIYPQSEYERRLNELKRYLNEHYPDVNLVILPYQYDQYMEELREFENKPEGGIRCQRCYEKRMNEAYAYAQENHFDYFTTVMTISRQKNSIILNEIGDKLSKKYPKTKYFFSDFKKHGGQDRSIELRDLNNLYQQDYCGCEYSIRKGILE